MKGFFGLAGEVDVLEDANREGFDIAHSDFEESGLVLHLTQKQLQLYDLERGMHCLADREDEVKELLALKVYGLELQRFYLNQLFLFRSFSLDDELKWDVFGIPGRENPHIHLHVIPYLTHIAVIIMRMLAVIFNEVHNGNAVSQLAVVLLYDRLQLLAPVRFVLDVEILI